jgi:hypothetical protein
MHFFAVSEVLPLLRSNRTLVFDGQTKSNPPESKRVSPNRYRQNVFNLYQFGDNQGKIKIQVLKQVGKRFKPKVS